jgi:hypothetical protein
LNFAATNGEITVATRFRNSDSEDPPSLYYTTCSKYTCSKGKTILEHSNDGLERSVVVSSEPLTDDLSEWALMPPNSMLIITPENEVQMEKIDCGEFVKCTKPQQTETSSPRAATNQMQITPSNVNCKVNKGPARSCLQIQIYPDDLHKLVFSFATLLLSICIFLYMSVLKM